MALAVGSGPAGEVFPVSFAHVVNVLVSGLRLASSCAGFRWVVRNKQVSEFVL
jgi:hypothetical protein